ncbi:MAG TPA: transcriptional regulator, partial [Ruminococcaceae bacterium]|nr:transcriptional regulator [Oscillospiraceae bacterium]
VEDEKVQSVLDVISKYSKKRTQIMPTELYYGVGAFSPMPIEVSVGGATVFVLPVERFEKV